VLFAAHGAYGHALPLAGLACALGRAGHDVRFAVADELHPALASLGIHARPAGLSDSAMVAEARRRWPDTVRQPPARWAVRMFTDIAAPAMARDVRAMIAAWRPDLVIREEGEYGAALAAAGTGVRWVTHGWGSPAPAPEERARISELLGPRWHRGGEAVSNGDELYGAGLLDPCPSSLPVPARPAVPTCSIRPQAVDLGGEGQRFAAGGRELVYVGFGTVPLYRDDPTLLTMLARSVLAAGFRVVVTTSDRGLGSALRALDERHVAVRGWVSLPRVLPACRLAVCHGGAGTVLAALTAGVPLLLLPRGAPSQTRMAAACRQRGVARVVEPGQATPADLGAALADLTADDRFGRSARDVAREIAEMPAPDAAVPWLEALDSPGSHPGGRAEPG
jgi:UDP:flavonoid glycosyltransferase YjiC (YdhE family)